jgi:hypothetical protein
MFILLNGIIDWMKYLNLLKTNREMHRNVVWMTAGCSNKTIIQSIELIK